MKCAFSFFCREQVFLCRIVDDADDFFAAVFESDRDSKERNISDEVFGTVDRVDDPAEFIVALFF